MPRDRMADLQRGAASAADAEADFSRETSPILAKLQLLRQLTTQLESDQAQHLAAADKRTQKRIEKTVADIAKEAMICRNLIIAFGDETQRLERVEGLSGSRLAMRKNLFNNLSTKLVDVTRGAWDMQNHHSVEVTRQVEKRLRVRFTESDGTQSMDESEVQRIARELVQTGNEDKLFILARDELDKALATREAVKELERDMRELYQMFCDLNVLVVQQGEGVQEVRERVETAHTNLEQGNRDLKQARKYQKCCVMA